MAVGTGRVQLERGQDFRQVECRREVFLRFYAFHLRYRSHPGCVYYLMPWLRKHEQWTEEEALWFAFLNGNTQHPPTSLLLFNVWREAPRHRAATEMLAFYRSNYDRLAFDTDRRYHKKALAEAVEGYVAMTRSAGQWAFWRDRARIGWQAIWRAARSVPTFGRLSAFSYTEYLRIMGVPFDCEDLFLDDMQGSKSHRNGLCKVLGHDELDWHVSNPTFDGRYGQKTIRWLEVEAAGLIDEMRARASELDSAQEAPLGDWTGDIGYFTLESALCTYKSWHRVNRRYPNVYNDMLYDRLKLTERQWGEQATRLFWQARQECLPAHLRLEDNPGDPGCVPIKQNWYREQGQPPVIGHDYPELWSEFDDAVAERRFGVYR